MSVSVIVQPVTTDITVNAVTQSVQVNVNASDIANDIAALNAKRAEDARDEAQEIKDSIFNSFDYFLINFSIEPFLIATIQDGAVYSYTLDGVTRFRFVPDPYDPRQDAFYEDFDGTDLLNLIIRRG